MKGENSKVIVRRPVVWVTGASGGIGREIARQFAFLGCEVCLSARNKEALRSAIKEISGLGGRSYSFPLDITRLKSVRTTGRLIRRKIGEVDILVNNAGISSFKTFLDTSLKDFNAIVATNLLGHAACIKEVLPSMLKRKSGFIFNIISMAALKTFSGSSAYTASKAGLLGLGRVLREELKTSGIKVVNIIPGATSTDIWHPKVRRKYAHRMMKSKSVAEAVLSAYQMPEDLVVDELVIRPLKGDLNQ